MTPIRFPGANVSLSAPPSWDAASLGECSTLPARFDDSTGTPIWTVKYMPSEEEVQAFLRGEPLTIAVVSPIDGFAPIAVSVGD